MSDALVIEPLDKRPDLASTIWKFEGLWPTFMVQDPMSDMYYATVDRDHPEHVLIAYEPDQPDTPVARAFTVPFEFGTDQRAELPDDGWDGVIRWAALDRNVGRPATHVSALEIAIRPDQRGTGLAAVMLAAMRDNVRRLGFTELFAPVRPSGKPAEPHTPMSEYAYRTRDDGLPVDPWLRVHVRAGGEILRVCPRAMTISGSLAEWREWTGLPFDRTGDVEVPGALVPVHCSVEHDHAVYVEPGVWVRHTFT
ncbi:GNAT family N-acetyltransferase [Phytoactinopolyspora halotolerans]|uniref:N-acetyltransferase n=1 Tax=Phytoactinopolyspora halotolerans TaxID=1981512 RepID=A0A6L9S4U0_9ACTN|nr:N-acetyltransferase [Phytoactinopolyspora halotolerans]NEE00139.1 N-acetyltransferase [Phytoactinopolyspora halotolerans]